MIEYKRIESFLKCFNEELEKRVSERTKELENTLKLLKESEKKLKESEEKYRKLFEAESDAIILYEQETCKINDVNRAASSIYGYSREEFLNMKTIHISAEPEVTEEASKNAIPFVPLRFHKKKDGTVFPVEITCNPIELGGIKMVIAAIRNITERIKIQEELRLEKEKTETINRELKDAIEIANEMARKSEVANKAKSDFLARMSHEIRTPMNGVIGLTGLLLDTDLTQEQMEYGKKIKNSADSLLTIINDILDFSKIEAGKLSLEIMDFNLRLVLEDFCDAMAIKSYEKDIKFNCLIKPDVPSSLRGDPGRLRQILTNLVGNAFKFTGKGQVSIVVENLDENNENIILRFSVTDTGIGISRDNQELLFSPFMQIDGSTSRKFGGTGLGLAISRQLVELMGGEIGVESNEGIGSTFWFTVVFEKARAVFVERACDISVFPDKKILSLDDNKISLEIISLILDEFEILHHEVTEPSEALNMLLRSAEEGNPYDFLIFDKDVKGMTAVEFAGMIKSNPAIGGTKLIIVTSSGKYYTTGELIEHGFDGCLKRPIKKSVIFNCLSSLLSGNRIYRSEDNKINSKKYKIHESVSKFRILVAEDNIVNQQVARGILEKFGYSVDVSANGKEAIKFLEELPYDLVLMDCEMPEMDGFEATSVIRRTKSGMINPQIPIIAMTAHAIKGYEEKCIDAGMNDYITKPVVPDVLFEKINSLLVPLKKDEYNENKGVPSDKSVFDYENLMKRLMNDRELARDIIIAFIDNFPLQFSKLEDAVHKSNNSDMKFYAHNIKGASQNVNAIKVSFIATEIENSNNDIPRVNELLDELMKEFEYFKNVLMGLNII